MKIIITKIFFIAVFANFIFSQPSIYGGLGNSSNLLLTEIPVHDSSTNKVSLKHKKDPNNLDVSLFRSINNSRSSFKESFLPIFDRSGPPMAFVMPITEISYGRLSKHTYDENSGYLLGISEGLNLLLTFGTKFMVKRKRPYAALENVYHRENVGTDPYSFPSGHTSITFTIAALFNLRYPKYPQVYVPMYLYSLIVAYGRPYFGMHYPTDLLGGAVIGTGSSILIFSLRNHLFRLKNKILSESKDDTGSINGNNIILFGCAFIISNFIGQLIAEKNDKINIGYIPDGTGGRFNIRVKF